MSDHEFNNYLTLLAGLLRLGDKQRRAIAEELRTHLEDRLEDLLGRGVPRDQAIQRALAEFGDAAGLAAQFASISRGRRRRWLMRLTTFSVAATVLIAAGIATFWPGRNAGPGPAAAVAQAPGGLGGLPGAGVPELPGGVPGPAKVDKPLEAKLNERIDVDFVETPLKEAIAFLSDRTGVQFVIRKKTLEDSGIAADTPVTWSLKQVRLDTILELMLKEVGLVYTEKDDLLVITTPDDAESTLEIRVYDCRDLLAMPEPGSEPKRPGRPNGAGGFDPLDPPPGYVPPAGSRVPSPPTRTPGDQNPRLNPGPGGPRVPDDILPQFAPPDVLAQAGGLGGGMPGGGLGGPMPGGIVPTTDHELRAQRLINLIMTNVDPQGWSMAGGAGSISEYHGLIVVTQTSQTHKKVEHVLNMLRQAAGLETPQGQVVR